MPLLQRPFWVVIEREHILNPPAEIPCNDSKALIAFSDTERLTAFLSARVGGRWKVDLVPDRDAEMLVVAELHRLGVSHICFDCQPDGSAGHLVDIREIIA